MSDKVCKSKLINKICIMFMIIVVIVTIVAINKYRAVQQKIIFEEQHIEDYKEKLSQTENNPNYYRLEQQFMTAYSYPTDILFLGDSITQGCYWNELYPGFDVKNRGIGSDTTEGVLVRLDSVVKTKPTKIFILIGVNDIALGVDEKDILSNYNDIIDTLQKECPYATIYVQSILPVLDHIKVDNTDIVLVNDMIQEMCIEQDIIYIDLYSSFIDEEGKLKEEYYIDSIHITGLGYECWKKIIDAYIY